MNFSRSLQYVVDKMSADAGGIALLGMVMSHNPTTTTNMLELG
jgi:hypothetical protein